MSTNNQFIELNPCRELRHKPAEVGIRVREEKCTIVRMFVVRGLAAVLVLQHLLLVSGQGCRDMSGWSKKQCKIEALHRGGLKDIIKDARQLVTKRIQLQPQVHIEGIVSEIIVTDPGSHLADAYVDKIRKPCLAMYKDFIDWMHEPLLSELNNLDLRCRVIIENLNKIGDCLFDVANGRYDRTDFGPVPEKIPLLYSQLYNTNQTKQDYQELLDLSISYICPNTEFD